jgi:amino acid adenylation domain-containing protein
MDFNMIAEQREQVMQYWLTRFRLGHDGSGFPSDRRRPRRSHDRARTTLSISTACWSEFTAVCKREGIERCHAVLGLLQILLHRYIFADTIEVGTHCFPMLFPVLTEIVGSSSVRSNLSRAALAAQGASANACSWEDLQIWTRQAGLPPDQPLFRVLLSTSNLVSEEGHGEREIADEVRAQCDLVVSLRLRAIETCLEAEYDLDLYKRKTVERILAQLTFLIDSLETLLDQSVDRIPLCFPDEARSLIREIASQRSDFPVSHCMHQRFEEQVRKTPDAVAVVMPGDRRQQLTYSHLNACANRLARYLQSKGVGPDVLVGLYLDRTPDLIVALIAILKAGGAYLPIDLSYPPERVAFMLSDSEAPVVITDSQTARNLPQTGAAVVCMDENKAAWASLSSENPCSSVAPENLVYSIFTSGSTGKPKGVLITHANVSRLFDATQPWFHFSEQDTWTFFHSSAFDFSVWEIWGALIYGGRLIIVPFADSRSPERFYELLAAEHVTVLNQTPSAFRQLVGVDETRPGNKLDKLRMVIFGGEVLNLQSLAPWFDKYGDVKPQLVNMYGITETTVHVTYRPLTISDLSEAPGSVIGRSIPDLQLYVLDAGMQPVPVGVPGEMFVGGAGVARGYLKRDALTAERFVQNPFSSQNSEKLYRSGDLARRLPDGDLEYMGRADQQVKIRGFRVELGEVQSALTRQPSVREAFVVAKESGNGEKVLVAYVVPACGQVPGVDKLRRDLQSTLPSYMVPSNFVFLDQLPLTSNGKVDRAALPAASVRRSEMEQAFNAPQTDLERNIARVYREVLSLDEVGIDDDFFDLGGNSLRLVEVHAELHKLIGRSFSVADLFAHTTVRQLAASFNDAGLKQSPGKELLNRAQRQRQAICAGRNRRR